MAAGGSAACSGWGSCRLIISARTVLTDQLLRAWIEDRGARRKGKYLKIGEGLPATLAIIAAAGLLKRLQIRQAAGQGGDQFVPHTPTGSWAFTGSASSRAIPVGSLMSRHSKVGPMNSSV